MTHRKYAEVFTASLVGGGFSGFNTTDSDFGVESGARSAEAAAAYTRACAAAEAAFRASGAFPGYRPMRATVRVDGSRAIVCMARGRHGW